MRSIGAGGVTVVSIITLVFAQVGHGRHVEQVDKSTTVTVPCRAHTPCRVQRSFTNKIVLPDRRGDDGRGGYGRATAVAATTTAASGAR